MKFSGRFKSRLEANVGIGGCESPQQSSDTERRITSRASRSSYLNPLRSSGMSICVGTETTSLLALLGRVSWQLPQSTNYRTYLFHA
jgi:hypothetical protein